MNYIIDTCFWIALYDAYEDPLRTEEAEIIAELIENETIIIPFPTMYEFLNSKFSRTKFVHVFEKLISRPNFIKIKDVEYKEKAYDSFFHNAKNASKDVSLVDEIIKEMILDKKLRIDCLITFDEILKNYATACGIKTN